MTLSPVQEMPNDASLDLDPCLLDGEASPLQNDVLASFLGSKSSSLQRFLRFFPLDPVRKSPLCALKTSINIPTVSRGG